MNRDKPVPTPMDAFGRYFKRESPTQVNASLLLSKDAAEQAVGPVPTSLEQEATALQGRLSEILQKLEDKLDTVSSTPTTEDEDNRRLAKLDKYIKRMSTLADIFDRLYRFLTYMDSNGKNKRR